MEVRNNCGFQSRGASRPSTIYGSASPHGGEAGDVVNESIGSPSSCLRILNFFICRHGFFS